MAAAVVGNGKDNSSPTLSENSAPLSEQQPILNTVKVDDELEYGFKRPEMYQIPLSGTVDRYECHLFLCYKSFESWPARVEGSESDHLPRLLAAALKSRKKEIKRNTRLTICEGRDGTDNSNGDILIFPDMVRYRGLTQFDVDTFVEDVLVNGREWASGKIESLTGSHVFVCCHGSRDRRCGVCGPPLVDKFHEEIESRRLKDQVFVSPCSHVGGHKYAGNLIIFSSVQGKITGHWYGYVTPDDVPVLLDQHIIKGRIVDPIWRGRMGASVECEEEVQVQQSLQSSADGQQQQQGGGSGRTGKSKNDVTSCCQGAQGGDGFSCCRDDKDASNKRAPPSGWWGLSTSWEQSDVLSVLALVGAAASVAVAYSMYRKSS